MVNTSPFMFYKILSIEKKIIMDQPTTALPIASYCISVLY